MKQTRTTVAISKAYRPAIDILAENYKKDRNLFKTPTVEETIITALMECLEKRGVTFLPAPDDGERVPVVMVNK